jgi:hypothetical protein
MVRCNQTNRSALANAWGPDTDKWLDNKIELSVQPTSMGPGIRMVPIIGGKHAAGPAGEPPLKSTHAAPASYPASKATPKKSRDDLNDEIPF